MVDAFDKYQAHYYTHRREQQHDCN
jgi:hypothetical protein